MRALNPLLRLWSQLLHQIVIRLSDNIYFSHKVWFDLWIKHAGSSQLLVTVATGADGGTTVIRPKFSSSDQTLLQTTGKICTAGNLGLHSTLYDFCKLS